MGFDPDLEEQEHLADTFRRAGAQLAGRELSASVLAGAGYVAVAIALRLAQPAGSFALIPAALCVLALVLATCVRFDTPLGFTVPTQLAFVPLMFVMPAADVPIAVVLALALARIPQLLSRSMPASRLLQIPGNSWFAIGPATVFVATHTEAWRAGPGLLIAALAAQFLLDFGVSSVRYAIAVGARLSSQLSETWVYLVDAGLAGPGLVLAHATRSTPIAILSLLPLLALFALLANERHDRLESLVELNNAYRGTALVLGDVVEADDGYTAEHSREVVRLALAVANELGLDAQQRRNLEFGALLHDVGKIAIPKEIINKPGNLDPTEWTLVQTHTLEGQQMLQRVGGFMREVGMIVRSHHERWDGLGYPDGLLGDAIPIEARIITCCDSWSAMRTDRSYRKALSHEAALAELAANSGTQFDPRVVAALVKVVEPAKSAKLRVGSPADASPRTAPTGQLEQLRAEGA
jgi:putative nucleotidyltransferase with HDIG domain